MKKTGVISLDVLNTDCSLTDLPDNLLQSYRQLRYRLQLVSLYDSNNDIRFYIPSSIFMNFLEQWSKWSIHTISREFVNEIISLGYITLDGNPINLSQYDYDKNTAFLVIHRSGETELVNYDKVLARNMFRAPWAIAQFNII